MWECLVVKYVNQWNRCADRLGRRGDVADCPAKRIRRTTCVGCYDVPPWRLNCKGLTFDAHCCHIGTAIKHHVPDRVKPSFVIFDIRALWRSAMSVRVPGCQKLQMTALPGLAQDALQLYPYGNSGRQRVNGYCCGCELELTLADLVIESTRWTHASVYDLVASLLAVHVLNSSVSVTFTPLASCDRWSSVKLTARGTIDIFYAT